MIYDFIRRILTGKIGGSFDEINKNLLDREYFEKDLSNQLSNKLVLLENRANEHFKTRNTLSGLELLIWFFDLLSVFQKKQAPIHLLFDDYELISFGKNKSVDISIEFQFSNLTHIESFQVIYELDEITFIIGQNKTSDIQEFCYILEVTLKHNLNL